MSSLLEWTVNDHPSLGGVQAKYIGSLNKVPVAWINPPGFPGPLRDDWTLYVELGLSNPMDLAESSYEKAKERADREVRRFFKRIGALLGGQVAQAEIVKAIRQAAEDAAHESNYETRLNADAGDLWVPPTDDWARSSWRDAVKGLIDAGILSPDALEK